VLVVASGFALHDEEVIDPNIQRPIGILSTLDIAGVLAWGET
jgi:hypothetical protein